ncbi:unnamed protein product [Prorocentrum cordatum]|uniref:Uncharacterized protein n=1 Tax=Prorocentrum cordatum TaxID=2364126 RepID=A0ABN9SA59_9DINO|nr:unnamed protein product [Polarella glacialis]
MGRGGKGRGDGGGKGKWRAAGAGAAKAAGPASAGAPRRTPEGVAPARGKRPNGSGEAVAVVGGGLAGLACGWGLLERGLPAVVLDTGKRGPGGRASSRVVSAGGCSHVVDHAVQAFTASVPEVQRLLEQMEAAGAARRWRGRVGTVDMGGAFRLRDEAADGPLWIGSRERGVGAISEWLAEKQEVIKDVWVAKLRWADGAGWELLGQRGQLVGEHTYNYVVMAHNGKCADRLINTAPCRTAAHDPLRCRFTAKASVTSDRLELSSLWVCVLEAPRGVADFEGAFVEGSAVLSWVGNNSAKYDQTWARDSDVWTLVSTPEYGAKNKCPQEAIPADVRQKVSSEMISAFGAVLGPQRGGGLQRSPVLHLQLWGAALPLNVCAQHFIHDPEARVGVCGDWLTTPSVEGALFSGLALAEALARDLRRGGLPGTGSRRFVGSGGHALGHFGRSDAAPSAAEAVDQLLGAAAPAPSAACAEAGGGAPVPQGRPPVPAGGSRWRRREPASEGAAPSPAAVPAATASAASSAAWGREGQQACHGAPLRLAALAAWAVQGAGLVDIGANMSKCKPQDLAEQLARAAAAGVGRMILTGCSVKGSRTAQQLCESWSGAAGCQRALSHLGAAAVREVGAAGIKEFPVLTFTAGVHPHDASTCDAGTLPALRGMAAHEQCVAIGECGLDYDRMFSPRDVQLEWCRRQVELAVELGMPLFMHERDRDASKGPRLGSARDLLGILDDIGVDPARVCVHCYTGPSEELQVYVSRGFFIGLTGFVGMTRRGEHVRDYLKKGHIPLQQLMIETDCPFMMPDRDYLPDEIGLQGKRMEPCALPAVCRAAAECLGVPEAEVARATSSNSARFFAR